MSGPRPCPFCALAPDVAPDRSWIACRDTDCPVNPGVERNWKHESADEIEARWNTRKLVSAEDSEWKSLAMRAIDLLRDVERETSWGQPTFGPTVSEELGAVQDKLLAKVTPA